MKTSLPTARELQIGILLSEGLVAKEAAYQLGVSHKTAEVHIQNCMKKLKAHSRSQMVRKLIELGYIKVPITPAVPEELEEALREITDFAVERLSRVTRVRDDLAEAKLALSHK